MTTSQRATKAGEKDVTAVRAAQRFIAAPQVREFNDGGLTLTMSCEGISSTQHYRRD